MERRFFSESWHRVESLKPRLQAHVRLHRRERRGEPQPLIEDLHRGRFYHLPAPALVILRLLDGTRTVDAIWREAVERLGDEAPTQDDFVHLIGRLHRADLLAFDARSGPAGISRPGREESARFSRLLLQPFFWRVPLLDPRRMLGPLGGIARLVFSRTGCIVWLAVVGSASLLALGHWDRLTDSVADRILAPGNLLVLWGVFLALKLAHELGHALALMACGREVREMGIALLVVTPVPYVDASEATALPQARQRILVGAAGMMAEVFLGSLALFAWLALDPCPLRAILYDVIFAAGVATLLFNANPLVRFDGYYILGDALGIPNLYPRSLRCLSHLAQRRLLGCRELPEFQAAGAEKALLIAYGLASLAYRFVLLAAITAFLAGRFRWIGAFLALWALIAWVAIPIARGVHFILASPKLRPVRMRAALSAAGLLLLVLGGALFVSLPSSTVVEGVVILEEDAIVSPGVDLFIRRMVGEPGRWVARGDPIFDGEDPRLAARIEIAAAEIEELLARRDFALRQDPVRAQMINEEIARRERVLEVEQERFRELTIRSRGDGILIVPRPEDLPGRFVTRGFPIAYVASRGAARVRVAVPQEAIDRVRRGTCGTVLRLPDGSSPPWPTRVVREAPAASIRLPSPVLGTLAGGGIPADPRESAGSLSLEGTFHLDLELPDLDREIPVGGRVLVRFEHDSEPLAPRLWRSLCRLFPGWSAG